MPDKRLLNELRSLRAYKAALVLNGIAAFIAVLLQSLAMAKAVDAIFMRHQAFSSLAPWFLLFFGVVVARFGTIYFFERFFRKTARGIRNGIRMRYAAHLLSGAADATGASASGSGAGSGSGSGSNTGSGSGAGSGAGSGSRAAVFCEAADALDIWYAEYLPQFVLVVLIVPAILLTVLFTDPASAALMAVTIPTLPLFLALAGHAAKEASEARLVSLKRLGGSFLDLMRGMGTLILFGHTGTGRRRVMESSEAFRKTTMEVLRVSFLSAFVLELAATIGTALVAVSLGMRLFYGGMSFFPAFFILLLTPDFYQSIRKLGARYHAGTAGRVAADALWVPEDRVPEGRAQEDRVPANRVPEGRVPANRVPEGRAQEDRVHEEWMSGPIVVDTPHAVDRIVIDKVTYRYPDALQDAVACFSAVLEPGRVTALVGPSGAGKTTLTRLLMNLLIPDQGGISWENGTRTVGRGDVALVPQQPFLFHDTVLDNIRLGRPGATEEEAIAAAILADADGFIKMMPNGYGTMLQEEGKNISGGQAQRIAFARAFLRQVPVVVVDEGTSALDAESVARIRKLWQHMGRSRIVLVIAHRLETVREADCIWVMDQGAISGMGTHEELLSGNRLYRELTAVWGDGA